MSLISQNLVLKKQKHGLNDEADVNIVKKKSKKSDGNVDSSKKEMKRLESFLFGSLYDPLEFGKEGAIEEQGVFFVDKSGGNELVVYEEDVKSQAGSEIVEERKPAWIDDEEEKAEVDIVRVNRLRKLRKEVDEKVVSGKDYVARLRAQHEKLNLGTDWAKIDRKSTRIVDDLDAEGDVDLHSNGEIVMRDSVRLLPGLLEFSRLVDANAEEPSNGPINSVQFHRNGQLLLTAGLDKGLRFFQVDGKRNPKVQSIFIEDCPIHKASFLPDGSEVIVTGRRKFFYSFDLVKATVSKIGPLTGREEKSIEVFEVSPDSSTIAFIGNEGYILLVSSRSKELIGTLKMNGSARSLAFTQGGQQLLSSGGDGHIYHWDLRTRRCIHKGVDEGSLTGSALCTSPDSSLFAAGSTSGIVNIYKREEFLGGNRKPLKTLENLTTLVDTMKFNHDAQILAITSGMKKNGLKLVHIPSFNIFSNFPPPRFSVQYPRCLDFSPGGGFMTVGNAAGKVLLYKLHHYKNA